MKPFVILISPSNMEEAIQKFKEAGFDSIHLNNDDDGLDCIGRSDIEFGVWWYDKYQFKLCRHFEESQIDECINWLKS